MWGLKKRQRDVSSTHRYTVDIYTHKRDIWWAYCLSSSRCFVLYCLFSVPDGYTELHVLISTQLSAASWRKWIIKGAFLFIRRCYSRQSLSPELWFPSRPFGSYPLALGKMMSKCFLSWWKPLSLSCHSIGLIWHGVYSSCFSLRWKLGGLKNMRLRRILKRNERSSFIFLYFLVLLCSLAYTQRNILFSLFTSIDLVYTPILFPTPRNRLPPAGCSRYQYQDQKDQTPLFVCTCLCVESNVTQRGFCSHDWKWIFELNVVFCCYCLRLGMTAVRMMKCLPKMISILATVIQRCADTLSFGAHIGSMSLNLVITRPLI